MEYKYTIESVDDVYIVSQLCNGEIYKSSEFVVLLDAFKEAFGHAALTSQIQSKPVLVLFIDKEFWVGVVEKTTT